MERIVSFITGVVVIVVSNLLSNYVKDSVILDTSVVKITNLGALTAAGIGAIIYSIPPNVFTSFGAWVLKLRGKSPDSSTSQTQQSPPEVK